MGTQLGVQLLEGALGVTVLRDGDKPCTLVGRHILEMMIEDRAEYVECEGRLSRWSRPCTAKMKSHRWAGVYGSGGLWASVQSPHKRVRRTSLGQNLNLRCLLLPPDGRSVFCLAFFRLDSCPRLGITARSCLPPGSSQIWSQARSPCWTQVGTCPTLLVRPARSSSKDIFLVPNI